MQMKMSLQLYFRLLIKRWTEEFFSSESFWESRCLRILLPIHHWTRTDNCLAARALDCSVIFSRDKMYFQPVKIWNLSHKIIISLHW